MIYRDCHSDQNERTQSKLNYFKANYGKIRGILRNVDWEDILAGTFTDSYGLFVEILYSALEGNVPERVPRAKKQNVYMNKDSIALKNRKQKLWKKYILSRSRNDYNKFVKCKNDLRSLTRSLRRMFEKKLADNSNVRLVVRQVQIKDKNKDSQFNKSRWVQSMYI